MNICEEYNRSRTTSSDINEHLETLYGYASLPMISSITEMGTRFGSSTRAFLYAISTSKHNKTLCSYDLFKSDDIEKLKGIANFKFYQEDTLKCVIDKTDLLFIDTLHTYFQLYEELKRHSAKVSQYIILHDTTTYGDVDESYYSLDCAVKQSDLVETTNKSGLNNAIYDFLLSEEDGKNWNIKEVFKHNNGLTVLERISNLQLSI